MGGGPVPYYAASLRPLVDELAEPVIVGRSKPPEAQPDPGVDPEPEAALAPAPEALAAPDAERREAMLSNKLEGLGWKVVRGVWRR